MSNAGLNKQDEGFSITCLIYHTKELLKSLEVINKGKEDTVKEGSPILPTTANTYEMVIDDKKKEVKIDGEKVKLTPIEYNILLFLAENKGKVFSIEQIYENVWKEPFDGCEKKVVMHISHIREKIEINPKEPKYLKIVWGLGYKMEDL